MIVIGDYDAGQPPHPPERPVLERREQDVAWELRTLWARRKAVLLTLSERCVVPRLFGRITYVAESGAYCEIGGWHVPCVDVLGVNVPTVAEREALADEMREASRRAAEEDEHELKRVRMVLAS